MAEKEAERRSVDGRIAQVERNKQRLRSHLANLGSHLAKMERELDALRKRRQELCPHQRVIRADRCPVGCDLWDYDSAGFGSTAPEVRMCEDCGYSGDADDDYNGYALFGADVPARTVSEEEFQRLYDLFPHFRF